ncbi:hypothetical protein VM98_20595 [Streptomyces rubellomurinus subsp. indigoferus]|uniref:Secreted protein n=1 Tax=Streptomyces rubellomurinus (strain ATCC 31215) TaxID=359131 RepID=A0A0F2THH8_STRR3|nr:hypothetical protein VM98_20595 [Streptomyces rubellomurinus subsp. indigoferus]KJS61720.1 hypothetical protein VM95_13465 [Streptomyces rubellomurinus]
MVLTVAGIAGLAAGPAAAATATALPGTTACTAVVNHPCLSHEADGDGVVGVARVSAQPDQLTVVRVEIRTQAAWGSPWQTVAAATTVRFGSAEATTPRVTASGPRLVCATAGPALEADKQVTTCTNPF